MGIINQTTGNINALLNSIPNKGEKPVVIQESGTDVSLGINFTEFVRDTIVMCGTLSSLVFPSIENLPYEVSVFFSTGASVTNFLQLPAGTKIVNEIKIEASKNYVISILGGAVACGEINITE